MSKQTISVGTTANDGTGDPLRTAFQKANLNFDELYNMIRSGSASLNTGSNNVNFSSSLPSASFNVVAWNVDGIAVQVTGQTAVGFAITALEACNIQYIAILNI